MIRPEVFIAANLAILDFLGITVQAGGWNSSSRIISAALLAVTAYLLTVYLHPKALYLSLPLIVRLDSDVLSQDLQGGNRLILFSEKDSAALLFDCRSSSNSLIRWLSSNGKCFSNLISRTDRPPLKE